MTIYHHKKVIGIFCIALIGIGGVFVIAHGQRSLEITAQNNSQNNGSTKANVELVSASVHNAPAHTDVADSVGISSNLKNPYSYDTGNLSDSQGSSQVSQLDGSNLSSTSTATDRLAKDLFSKYLYMKQTGQDLTPTEEQNLVTNVLQTATLNDTAKTYQMSDLRIAPQETNQSLIDYGNALGNILIKDSPKNSQNEIMLLAQIAQSNDQNSQEVSDGIAQLQIMSQSYDTILKDYLSLKIPKNIASLHLELVNIISALSTDIAGMAKINSDPVITAGSLARDSKDTDDLYAILGKINAYFQNQGVVFDPKSAGYAFTQIHQ